MADDKNPWGGAQFASAVIATVGVIGGAFFAYTADKAATSADLVKTLYAQIETLRQQVFDQQREMVGLRNDVLRVNEPGEILKRYMHDLPHPAWVKLVEGSKDDPQFVMWHINPAYERAFGVRLLRYVGKTDFEVWPHESARRFYANDMYIWKLKDSRCSVERFPGRVFMLDPPEVSAVICTWHLEFMGLPAIAGQLKIMDREMLKQLLKTESVEEIGKMLGISDITPLKNELERAGK